MMTTILDHSVSIRTCSSTPSRSTEYDASSQTTDTNLSLTTSNTTVHSTETTSEQDSTKAMSGPRSKGTSNTSREATPFNSCSNTPTSSSRPSRRAKPTLKAKALAAGSGRLSKIFHKKQLSQNEDQLVRNGCWEDAADSSRIQQSSQDTDNLELPNQARVVRTAPRYSSSLSPAPSSHCEADIANVFLPLAASNKQEIPSTDAKFLATLGPSHSKAAKTKDSNSSGKRKRTRTMQEEPSLQSSSQRKTVGTLSETPATASSNQKPRQKESASLHSSSKVLDPQTVDQKSKENSSIPPRPSRRSNATVKSSNANVGRLTPRRPNPATSTNRHSAQDNISFTTLRTRRRADEAVATQRDSDQKTVTKNRNESGSQIEQQMKGIPTTTIKSRDDRSATTCNLSCLTEPQLLYAFAAICEMDGETTSQDVLEERLTAFCVCQKPGEASVRPAQTLKLKVGQRSRLS